MTGTQQQAGDVRQRYGNGTVMAEEQSILCPGCHRPNIARARYCQYCGRRLELNSQGSDQYRIIRVIKSGGMGAVYEAIDNAGSRYAIKELLDRFTDAQERAEAITSFIDEATLLKRLAHPSIPRVYTNFSDTGRYYLVMEFVEGEDLEQLLEREGAQPEVRVLDWAEQLCTVLAFLHQNDLIYRDVKPSNVMIDRLSGTLKLVDFGIAKAFQPHKRGTLIGTPGYSPPEQYQGLATPASDIYALGATLHHLLSGRDPRNEAPFSFPLLRTIKPRLTPHTEVAIQKALAMQPHERWGSMQEFRQALLPARPQPAVGAAVAPPRHDTVLARPASSVPVVPGTQLAPRADRPVAAPRHPERPYRFGWLRRLLRRMVTLALIAVVVASVALYVGAPDLLASYLPWLPRIEEYLPIAETTPPALHQSTIVYDLEVTASAEIPEAELLQQFEQQFVVKLHQNHGPTAQIHPNRPLAYVVEPAAMPIEGQNTVRFQARIEGQVLIP